MSDRHTAKIFLTDFDESTYDGSGRSTVTLDRHTQPLLQMGQLLPIDGAGHVSLSDFRLPTDEERQAWQLRKTMGLKDHQIAKMLGTTRETVNRRIGRYFQKAKLLTRLCPSASCELLERLATN